jgi:hypothetical protein
LRTLTLTAKEKICVQEGQPCDALTCPFARGYYDRRRPAMRAALAREEITRPVLEAVSREHQVCPFELGLEVSSWVDVVVCDYNYVFDPKVYLRRHFTEEPGDYAFLVDEAHNLVDRAREMFSADLETQEIQDVRRALKQAVPRCAKALTRLTSALRKLAGPATLPSDASTELNLYPADSGSGVSRDVGPLTPSLSPSEGERVPARAGEGSSARSLSFRAPGNPSLPLTTRDFPADLLPPLDDALKQAETWLARNQPTDFREPPPRTLFPPALLPAHRRKNSTTNASCDRDHRTGPLRPRPAILPGPVLPPPAGAGAGQGRGLLLRHADAD